ncbi:MAG TPA: YhbY family RNA-binding protein [Casimicrobiaceae bacterium]|jgi:putative YhbY family RNA-binding protein|nr:YhbY family RNA-binding protein [Casimicrobiaceae bacterium]
MEPLLPSFRRALRARAHHLHPVVSIGHHGLTSAVLHEADVALAAHELIKVRVASDDRAERDSLLARICETLGCAPVQQIGRLLVLWRPRPEETTPEDGRGKRARRPSAASPKPVPADSRTMRTRPVVRKAPPGVPRAAMPRRRRGSGRAS